MTMYFTKDHEWVRIEGDTAVIGISEYAQGQLGDVVFVDLPEVGKAVSQGDEAAVVESVKAASEVYAPVSGTVTAVNDALVADPSLANSAPETDGWFIKLALSNPGELETLMNQSEYAGYVASMS